MNPKSKNAPLLIMIVALVLVDWATKIWMTSRLELGQAYIVIDEWFYIVHRQNPGVAFSMFSNLSDGLRLPILGALSLLGIFLFSRIIMTSEDAISRYAAAAVVGGAIGNFGDRVVTGEVTDFILVTFFPFVFNIADAAITVGGILLAVRLAMLPDRPRDEATVGGELQGGVGQP